MTKRSETILVLGATGQQGGATARALLADGWRVRALVRNVEGQAARALIAAGVDVVPGDLGDRASLDRALSGVHGVFSIQPSSGQPEYGVTDADEERFGISVADAATAAGVKHLVYTSVGGLRTGTGVGHFESKWRIEEHVRSCGVPATVVRPTAFMELLLLPHFGIANDALVFFLRGSRKMQFIAVEDIGVLVAKIFGSPAAYVGRTIELAGDALTGDEIASKIGAAVGRTVTYSCFPAEVLAANPVLARLVDLVDEGGAVGNADLAENRAMHPGVLTFEAWLAKSGKSAIDALHGQHAS